MSAVHLLQLKAIMDADGERATAIGICLDAGLPLTQKGSVSTAWYDAKGGWAYVQRTPQREFEYWYDRTAEPRAPRPKDPRKTKPVRAKALPLAEARRLAAELPAELDRIAELESVIWMMAPKAKPAPRPVEGWHESWHEAQP